MAETPAPPSHAPPACVYQQPKSGFAARSPTSTPPVILDELLRWMRVSEP